MHMDGWRRHSLRYTGSGAFHGKSFGHVDFGVFVRHPGGTVRAVRYVGLKLLKRCWSEAYIQELLGCR